MVVNLCARKVIDFPLISIGNDGVHNSCFSEIQQSRLAGLADGVKKVDSSIALLIDLMTFLPMAVCSLETHNF